MSNLTLFHNGPSTCSQKVRLILGLKNLTYDQICHEHVTYYTLTTFKNIVEKNKLQIQDINFK